jgi:transposase-like protein
VVFVAEPKTRPACLCGCGQTPKGAKSEFVLGHTTRYALAVMRRAREGDQEALSELLRRNWVDWFEKLEVQHALWPGKIDPKDPRSWPTFKEPPEYTDEQKLAALRLVYRHGSTSRAVVHASHETGIPTGEIRAWVKLFERLHRRKDVRASADVEFLRISREREQAEREQRREQRRRRGHGLEPGPDPDGA